MNSEDTFDCHVSSDDPYARSSVLTDMREPGTGICELRLEIRELRRMIQELREQVERSFRLLFWVQITGYVATFLMIVRFH